MMCGVYVDDTIFDGSSGECSKQTSQSWAYVLRETSTHFSFKMKERLETFCE